MKKGPTGLMLTLRSKLALLFTAAGMLASAGPATAAKVVAKNKKRLAIKVDEGFEKDSNVCFFKASKQVACGTVMKTSSSHSYVKVEEADFKRITKGMKAEGGEGGSDTSERPGKKKKGASKGKGKGKGKNLNPYDMALGLFYNPSLMGPVSFNNVNYLAPAGDGTATTLFDPQPYGSNYYSFGGSFEMFLSYPFGIAAGFRTRSFSFPPEVYTDYVVGNNEDYVRSSQAASEFGLYASVLYYMPLSDSSGLKFGGGLDYDTSTVKFSAGQWRGTKDTDISTHTEIGRLYSLTSNLTVISMKLDAFLNLMLFKPFAIDAGMTMFVPVSSSRTGDPEATDPNITSNAAVDGENDLLNALDHKATFGLEFLIGALITF